MLYTYRWEYRFHTCPGVYGFSCGLLAGCIVKLSGRQAGFGVRLVMICLLAVRQRSGRQNTAHTVYTGVMSRDR